MPELTEQITTENAKKSSSLADTLNLKRQYPMSLRRALKKSFSFLVVALLVAGAMYLLDKHWIPTFDDPVRREVLNELAIAIAGFAGFIWIGRIFFFEMERLFYDYRVQGGNLYISKGILIKEKGSFPLSRITDLYLHRGLGDLIFGLSSLHVSTPTTASGEFAYIHGLTIRNAEALRDHLEKLIKGHDQHLRNIDRFMRNMAASPQQEDLTNQQRANATPRVPTGD